MSFNFYTLGGSQFWEDVFYYQKWRIQRNYKTKKYRLLDNWDIRRAEGTFDNCRRAFLKYIEVFQLSRQKGHMVILLHGLGDSKNIFKPLWREITKKGLSAAALNYPSTRKRIDGHVRQLDFFMNHLEDIDEVSFVTKGIGGLILRKLLSFDSPWRHRIKIQHIVEINPTNSDTLLFEKMSKFQLCNRILGPILQDLTPKNIESIPPFKEPNRVGIIQYNSLWARISQWFPQSLRKYFPHAENTNLNEIKNIISINGYRICPIKNEQVVLKCVKFLTQGKFR